jgi:carboxypeptidase family protein/TonB-dependent receptor-like protein
MLKVIFLLVILCPFIGAQTFRGALAGSVNDATGAAVRACKIEAVNRATGRAQSAQTGAEGGFSLQELPPGSYIVTADCPGFARVANSRVDVAISVTTTLRFTAQPATQSFSMTVAESIDPLETDTSARNVVVGPNQVQNQPLNGRDFLRLLRLAPGVVLQGTSFYAVNGNRGRSNNFQIDGADNNDAWQNASAGNQGGVSAVPNTLVPIEAIDQFSLQSIGPAEQGRNSGASVNLGIKSGSNALHGSIFYFNRNEALAENSPLAPAGAQKRKIRNHQYGFSLGGPLARNRTFYFVAFEGQRMRVGNALFATTPSDAWVERGRSVLRAFGLPENPLARNLLTLWPASGRAGAATANNFFSNADNDFVTDNGVIKLDHTLSAGHQLSVRYFGATGSQTAFSGSPYPEYFQVATSRLHNYALALTSSVSPTTVNQLLVGVNYFKPTFNDADRSADPVALGLNTGVTDLALRGAPTINLSGFAGVGPTQPQGRVDTTWHVADTLSLSSGRHQWKLGAELRFARLDVFNEINKRGTFVFDGTAGPWAIGTAEQRALGATFSQPERLLADLLAGLVSPNNGARIVRGRLARDLRQNSWDLFAHDNWRVSSTFSLNFGLRYTYAGILHDTDNTLTTFLLDQGIVTPGQAGLEHLYPRDLNNIAPRFGFAWQPSSGSSWVLRGGYGVYYDLFQATYFASNSISNSGASGVNANPANPGGSDPVLTLTRSNFQLVMNAPIFGDAARAIPPFGVYSVSQDLRLPYVQNYHLTLQYRLNNRASVQAAYVGSAGRKLPLTRNINAPLPGATGALQSRRPFGARFPEFGAINELQTIGNSSYNSLQTMLNVNEWKGLSVRVAHTYSKAIDNGSDARFIIPANSHDLRRERGRSDFDARHVFVVGMTYELPAWRALPEKVAKGWQFNSFISAHTGLPLDIRAGSNVSDSFDGADRVDLVGDPFAGVVQPANTTVRAFFNPGAFALPARGTFGNLGRNAISGPGFSAVDFSVFKTTAVRERASIQFRFEVFNLFNRANWANPGVSLASATSFGLITNTRNGGSAPGIGPGEPRNVQLALKVLF